MFACAGVFSRLFRRGVELQNVLQPLEFLNRGLGGGQAPRGLSRLVDQVTSSAGPLSGRLAALQLSKTTRDGSVTSRIAGSWPASWSRQPGSIIRSQCRSYFSSNYERRHILLSDPNTVLWGLIGINAAVFAMWRSNIVPRDQMRSHFTTSAHAVFTGKVHTLLMSAFSHAEPSHLATNMIALYFFGRGIGQHLGGRFLASLYIAGGIFASCAHVGYAIVKEMNKDPYWRKGFEGGPAALGASGAVNAIVMLKVLMNPRSTVMLYMIIPIPAALFGCLFIGRDLMGALSHHESRVAHAAHLGGAVMGALVWVWLKRRGRFYY